MKSIICLSGGIASGKTTVARALAERFTDVSVLSFGDVVRRRARFLGKPLERETLQTIGLELVAAGWQSFVEALLVDVHQSTRVLIVEGIRHREAIEELQRRSLADKFLTVYITIEPSVQEKRLRERGESLAGRTHVVESSLPAVEASADLIIDGSVPLVNITNKILNHL